MMLEPSTRGPLGTLHIQQQATLEIWLSFQSNHVLAPRSESNVIKSQFVSAAEMFGNAMKGEEEGNHIIYTTV